MKTKAFLTLTATALILGACSNDNVVNELTPLALSSNVEVQTKADVQDSQIRSGEIAYAWVDNTSNAALYNCNPLTANGSGGFTATTSMFFPQTGGNVNIYAMHGNFSGSVNSGDAFPISKSYRVFSDQTSDANIAKSDLIYAVKKDVAKTTQAVPLTFYHLLSKVQIAIKRGAGDPILASSGAVKLNGVYLEGYLMPSKTVDMTSQPARLGLLSSSSASGNITLAQNLTTDFASPVYNEAVVIPQSLAGKKLTVQLSGGGVLSYTFPAGTSLISGKKHIYHITLTLTNMTVESSIVSWDPVSSISGDAILE